MTGRVFSINVSPDKGEPKNMVKIGLLKEGFGFDGDAHAGVGQRQVSLLSIEEIEEVERLSKNTDIDFRPGLFAENITTEGLDLARLKIGDALSIGAGIQLKVTQIGKECHSGCSIFKKVGNCIMPKRGIFAIVEKGGIVNVNDRITLMQQQKSKLLWSKT